MERIRRALATASTRVQLLWVTALLLVTAVSLIADSPAAMVGSAVAIAVLLTLAGHALRRPRHRGGPPGGGPAREDRRLRGAFRRQSSPDSPGRPRRPRAPGRIPAAA